MDVSQMIRYMRQEAGITQEYLAHSVNLRKKSIERYETGDVLPTMAKFNEIAYVCGFKITLKKTKRSEINV